MQKPEDEKWTVTKLRMLLGRHVSAMEMAGSESSDHEAPTSSNPNHGGQRKLKSTAGGLLAGNGQYKVTIHRKELNLTSLVVFTVLNLTGLMNAPSIAHYKPGKRN